MKYSNENRMKPGCQYQEPSVYGSRVKEQLAKRDNYCDPGKADVDGGMKGAKSNTQPGAKGSR